RTFFFVCIISWSFSYGLIPFLTPSPGGRNEVRRSLQSKCCHAHGHRHGHSVRLHGRPVARSGGPVYPGYGQSFPLGVRKRHRRRGETGRGETGGKLEGERTRDHVAGGIH